MSSIRGGVRVWPRANFRVLIGTVEFGCAEVRGMASETEFALTQTASGLGAAAGAAGSAGVTPSGIPGADGLGPTIGADPDAHPPSARTPAVGWTLRPVTIRRAVDHGSPDLFIWRAAIVAGQPDLRDVTIQLLDSPNGQPVLAWRLEQAWPLSWTGPVFDALDPGVALEQVELAYARLQWLTNPQTGGA